MHYTIYNNDGQAVEGTFVPGHDIGNGWRRHIVQLNAGDTAVNPASTKGPLYGPAFIVYDVSPSGIQTHVHEDAGEFYDALGKGEITAPPRTPISEIFLVWDDTRAEHGESARLEKICDTVDEADGYILGYFEEEDRVYIERWIVGNAAPSETITPSW